MGWQGQRAAPPSGGTFHLWLPAGIGSFPQLHPFPSTGKFSWEQTKIFYVYMTTKDGAPADPALKQALADDEGSSTAYEEKA